MVCIQETCPPSYPYGRRDSESEKGETHILFSGSWLSQALTANHHEVIQPALLRWEKVLDEENHSQSMQGLNQIVKKSVTLDLNFNSHIQFVMFVFSVDCIVTKARGLSKTSSSAYSDILINTRRYYCRLHLTGSATTVTQWNFLTLRSCCLLTYLRVTSLICHIELLWRVVWAVQIKLHCLPKHI